MSKFWILQFSQEGVENGPFWMRIGRLEMWLDFHWYGKYAGVDRSLVDTFVFAWPLNFVWNR